MNYDLGPMNYDPASRNPYKTLVEPDQRHTSSDELLFGADEL